MKVFMVNGSPHAKGTTWAALMQVSERLEKAGIEVKYMHIGHKAIRGCIACGKCAETGLCIFDDDPVNEAIGELRAADGFVVGSPVYYAGPNGTVCSFMDRVFFLKSAPYMFKPACAVSACRRAGTVATMDRLNKYFTIARMPVVSSQYWNGVHGMNAEEEAQDLEGIQTMHTLGDNMAWLMKCIEAGKKNGINPPEPEPWIGTNFIR